MVQFWKSIAGLVVASILILSVNKQEKDMALMLTMTACIMAAVTALSFLQPVISFLQDLEKLGMLPSGILGTLMKITGIGLTTELSAMVCQDSGNSSLAQAVKLLGAAVILSFSIPMLEMFLDVIGSVLGDL